jgi:hypothetical protein
VTTKTYKRIILHAGLHKTGTTSIQDSCYKYRDFLLQRGIVYPCFTFDGKKYTTHSIPIAAALRAKTGIHAAAVRLRNFQDPQRATKVFFDQLQEVMEKPTAETLLLSAEQVCEFDNGNLKALRHYLEKYAESLEVIAYVRSPHHSLVSIIQQRCRMGFCSDPAEFLEVVKERYQRLKHSFSDDLRIVNFHEAVEHSQGLVGYFLCDIGIPVGKVAELDFASSNESVSMEAYILMKAINQTFPRDNESLQRTTDDMHSLNLLPGEQFQLTDKVDPQISQSLEEQRKWLEQELQTSFPGKTALQAKPLWQQETLLALESAINTLDSGQMREVARKTLEDEAAQLESHRPETSAVLKYIAQKVCVSEENPPTELILEKLGADYFKFSALQVEQGSTEMSLLLMELAQKFRSDAPFIAERIQHYRDKLKET